MDADRDADGYQIPGATYMFLRGISAASHWWWTGYAAAITLLALLNLTGLLLVAAHGVSLHILRRSSRRGRLLSSTGCGVRVREPCTCWSLTSPATARSSRS